VAETAEDLTAKAAACPQTWHDELLFNKNLHMEFLTRRCAKCHKREIWLEFLSWDENYPALADYERQWLDQSKIRTDINYYKKVRELCRNNEALFLTISYIIHRIEEHQKRRKRRKGIL
jgi:hypothetical protein